MRAHDAAQGVPRGALLAALLLARVLVPDPASAAFELRDASPAALGAASTDGAWLPFLDEEEVPRGWRVGGSRATIFGADGIALSQLYGAAHRGSRSVRLEWAALSGAGSRESAARAEIAERSGIGERPASAVSLAARVERLDFAPEGSPRWGGWTLGGSACASLGSSARSLRAWVRGDRLARTGALERAAVRASIELGASLHAGGSTFAILDRWEPDAAHSPRIALELPLGEAARVRFARGAAPGRIGAALKFRLGKLEVAWGRLDYSFGGTIAAVQVGIATSKGEPPPPRPAGEARAALSVPKPSAIMRRDPRIEGFVSSDSLSNGVTGWLPPPEDELESLEPLAEGPSFRAGALLRGTISEREGRFRMRRIAAFDRGRGARWEVGFLEDEGRWRPGAIVAPGAGRLTAAAGRVSVAQGPTLFAETMRWTRPVSRVSAPRAGAPRAAPSRGASPAALDGGAVGVRGAVSCWALAGLRSESGERVAALGLGLERGRARYAAALGARAARDGSIGAGAPGDARLCGSITAIRRGPGRETSAELLAARDGRAALVNVERRSGRALLSARWRYRSWTARKVAAELSAEAIGPASRARLLWRAWSGSASADDGLLELEAMTTRVGAGPLRLRAGALGLGGEGRAAAPRERYAVFEAAVARDRSRSLSFHTSRRESAGRISRAVGATVGARLDLTGTALGDHSVLVEVTRLRRGGAAAWGSSLHASGAETLRTRSRPGLWLVARGGVGPRSWRLGYALERGEDPAGSRPWSGTVWLRLGHAP